VVSEPISNCLESWILSPVSKLFFTSSNKEVPLFHEDCSSWVGLDKESWKLDGTIDDYICNVDSGDYDNVLSVAELPKRRRSSLIIEKLQRSTRMI